MTLLPFAAIQHGLELIFSQKSLSIICKRLDGYVCCVVNCTSDMEVRSFFYARKDDGYIVRHEENDHANENTGGGSCAR